jgi:hypothetical protein
MHHAHPPQRERDAGIVALMIRWVIALAMLEGGPTEPTVPPSAPDDPVVRELWWIDRELAKPIVLPSPNALYRRARLRYHRARLEKLL